MSHKIIEKDLAWDDFVAFIFGTTVLQYEGYCFDISRVRLEKDAIVASNGPFPWRLLHKEDNQTIKYGLGIFYFNSREYDQKQLEETDYDGYPIIEDLPTYKLVEKELKLHQLKTL